MYCRTYPKHPKANAKGLYPLHRVLAENKIGRLLENDEEVHHKNEDKTDNHPDNLEVLKKPDHARKHVKPAPTEIATCDNCGESFSIPSRLLRTRKRRNKSGKIFCSRSCGATV
jgi:DNA-directed RNA polymerase subunit M/transcription elongation factor TFIIS